MIKCKVLVKDNNKKIYRYEYAYSVNEFDFSKLKAKPKRRSKYISLPMTFDIETSKIKKKIQEEGRNDQYEAFMYIWQVCLEGNVIFGRTWKEFLDFLENVKRSYNLHPQKKLVVYVHNLSYEFQFLYRFIEFKDVFATDSHAVLTAKNDYFDFRCSYKMTNMSLEKATQDTPNVVHIKAVEDLDYDIVRTPSTKLTEVEYGYCFNDVRGLYEVLLEYLKNDTLNSIKLTSTGFVRRDCRNAMRKNSKNREKFQKSQLDLKQYQLLKECFRGGNTASNRYHTNCILNNVGSYDISSSYPFVMLAFKYPSGPFVKYKIESLEELNRYNHQFCTIGRYRFENIRLKDNINIPYIPFSKIYDVEGVSKENVYNGRVMEAKAFTISLTNVDFDIISTQYEFDGLYVYDFYFAHQDYLPKELKDEIFHYFEKKSKLKGVEGSEYEYTKSKNKLNSIYGMCVTDILHHEIKFEDGEYEKVQYSFDEEEELLDKYYKSRNNFLSYQWGVFVTAYARRQLQIALNIVGFDVVYCDTDSVKYLFDHDKDFEYINNKIRKYCKDNGIVHSVEVNSKIYELGTFDNEGKYDQFKTLGAKKYAFSKNGKLGITVSGLAKKEGANELERCGGLDSFKIGKVFNQSGRTDAQYNNDPIHEVEVNGEKIITASNVAIIDSSYTLGITDTMINILQNLF